MPKKKMKLVKDSKPARLRVVKDNLPAGLLATRRPAPLAPEVKADMVKAGVLAIWWLGSLIYGKITDNIANKVASRISQRNRGGSWK